MQSITKHKVVGRSERFMIIYLASNLTLMSLMDLTVYDPDIFIQWPIPLNYCQKIKDVNPDSRELNKLVGILLDLPKKRTKWRSCWLAIHVM